MDCLDVDKLSPTIFNDVCVASNILHNGTAYMRVQAALETCCGSDNIFTTNDDCYTYCNITTPFDTVMLNNCLLDTLDQDTSDSLNYDCFPFAWELSSTAYTSAGKIATTWKYPDQTWTVTESSGVVTTETFDYTGGIITSTPEISSPIGSTATKTTGTKSTSTTATPTSSKSTSGAGSWKRLSYGAGFLVVLSVLALVL